MIGGPLGGWLPAPPQPLMWVEAAMADRWAWLRGGVLLMALSNWSVDQDLESRIVIGCSWPPRVLVAKRPIAAGEFIDGALGGQELAEDEVPKDALEIAELELLSLETEEEGEYLIAGIGMEPGEIIRKGWLLPRRRSVIDPVLEYNAPNQLSQR